MEKLIRSDKKYIDLDVILKEKNPKLYRILPGFVKNYIRRVIHEKQMNEFLAVHGEKQDMEFIHAVIGEFNMEVKVIGRENIPSEGGCIFAANHPLGGLDAITMLDVISEKRTDLKFIVNDILLQLKNLSGLFTGVNKHGRTSTGTLDGIDKLYASEQGVLIFPAGLVSRKQKGKILDLEWKKSFITKSKKYNRPVIPVHIEARNSDRFYNLATWRKRIGIGTNIEMLFLVDEMYYQRNKTITIIFGAPVPSSVFSGDRSDREWAAVMREHVYALGSGRLDTLKKYME